MRKVSLRIFLLFSALAILAVPSAYAQSVNEQTANIPFAFTVGDKVFPAGTYHVTRINPQSDKAVLAIRSSDRRMSKIALTTPVQKATAPEKAKLVFVRYGDQYFLSSMVARRQHWARIVQVSSRAHARTKWAGVRDNGGSAERTPAINR